MAPSAASSASTALNSILPLIQAGDAYSAHQKARTFAARYLKSKNYAVAIQVLFESAKELLKAGQQGSGTDLGGYLIEAYDASGESITEESRGRLTQLIALTGADGAWRSVLISKAVVWSAKASGCPAGDPELQHYLGELFYKEGEFPEAEIHYLASGTRDSARTLAQVMFEWSRGGAEPGAYAARGVIPFLLTTNILAARTFLSHFLSLVLAAQPNLLMQQSAVPITDSPGSEMYVTSNATINFLQLAIATCQRADPQANGGAARNAWVRLCSRYAGGVGTTNVPGSKMQIVGGGDMKEAIAAISHLYFNVTPPRSAAGNPLQDMMASLFGGGLGGDAPQSGARRAIGAGRGRGSAPSGASGLD